MNKTFKYTLKGGCGRTDINLRIIENVFNMTIYSRWMGNKEINCELIGRTSAITPSTVITGTLSNKIEKNVNVITLYTDKIIDKTNGKIYEEFEVEGYDDISSVSFRLFFLGQRVEMDDLDNETEGVNMGGCIMNNENKYDTILMYCNNRIFPYCYSENDDYIDLMCKKLSYVKFETISQRV